MDETDGTDRYGELLVDRPATTEHPDVWVCTCLACGGRVTRLLRGLKQTKRLGYTSACVTCRNELRRGIGLRPLTKREQTLLLHWEVYGSLYSPNETERETQTLRRIVGRHCGGWDRRVASVDPLEPDPTDEPAGEETQTYAEIGDAVGVSLNRVRVIEQDALEKLRHPTRLAWLKRSLDSLNSLAGSYEDALIAMIDCVVPYAPSDVVGSTQRFAISALDEAIARAQAPKADVPKKTKEPNLAYAVLRGLGERTRYRALRGLVKTRAQMVEESLERHRLLQLRIRAALYGSTPCPCESGKPFHECHGVASP